MAVDLTDIEKINIKNVSIGKLEKLEELWMDKTCVIIFFRRWGCLYCRLWAKELSQIANILSNNNIRLIGIGPEELGVQEFIEGKFFDGEIYVDIGKKVYSKVGYKRYNYFSFIWYLFTRKHKNTESHVNWNFQGDWLQIGGALIVEKGGKILHSYRQEGAADQLSNEKILEVLDLAAEFKTRALEKDLEEDSDASELN